MPVELSSLLTLSSRLKYIMGDYNGARSAAMASLAIVPGDRETLNSHAASCIKLNVIIRVVLKLNC